MNSFQRSHWVSISLGNVQRKVCVRDYFFVYYLIISKIVFIVIKNICKILYLQDIKIIYMLSVCHTTPNFQVSINVKVLCKGRQNRTPVKRKGVKMVYEDRHD